MRVFSQINKCQEKKGEGGGALFLGLAKSIYYVYIIPEVKIVRNRSPETTNY